MTAFDIEQIDLLTAACIARDISFDLYMLADKTFGVSLSIWTDDSDHIATGKCDSFGLAAECALKILVEHPE